ncbi:Ku protein [Streptomyces canus]|uniref:Ku protein n=1 Tax=Streptomyces canus TaxID=58343 RepID=UPI002E28D75E|nr:Ku protein [Streptomyces canus]
MGAENEYAKDQVVAISDAELRELPLSTAKVPDGQVAAKPYKLLRQALDRTSKVAIGKYAWSGRERLGMLRLRDDVIRPPSTRPTRRCRSRRSRGRSSSSIAWPRTTWRTPSSPTPAPMPWRRSSRRSGKRSPFPKPRSPEAPKPRSPEARAAGQGP